LGNDNSNGFGDDGRCFLCAHLLGTITHRSSAPVGTVESVGSVAAERHGTPDDRRVLSGAERRTERRVSAEPPFTSKLD